MLETIAAILLGLMILSLPAVFILNLLNITGVVWGKIRGHRLVYLTSESKLHKTFAVSDVWGNLRSPEDFGNSDTWLLLNPDGSIASSLLYNRWKWADEEKA